MPLSLIPLCFLGHPMHTILHEHPRRAQLWNVDRHPVAKTIIRELSQQPQAQSGSILM